MDETAKTRDGIKTRRICEKYRILAHIFRETSRTWETAFDSPSNLMISIHDTDHKIIKVNKAYALFVNKPLEEIVGRHCYEIMHGASFPLPECPHGRCMLSGKAESFEFTDDKTGRFFEVTVSPRYSHGGELIGTVHIINDATSRKSAENKIREQNAHLHSLMEDLKRQTGNADRANQAKSRFLATMSHEIRTPLNGIVGMACLLSETDMNAEQRKCVNIINTSADVLLSLINGILDFSKIEAGRLSLDVLDFDLRNTLENAVEVLSIKTTEKKIRMGYVIAPLVPSALRGDAGRLNQVIMNLVSNAIKFTQRGEVAVRVDLDSQNETSVTLKFTVSDTGIGISPDRVGDLFEPFVQGDNSTTRRFGGTGLGLAISKQLVTLMNGVIGLESSVGRGSTFWFTAVFEKQKNPRKFSQATVFNFTGAKTLIVDDHEMNRMLLSTFLQENACRYAPVGSGRQAIEFLRKAVGKKDPFHLALIEMNLPDMSGEELANLIKADPDIAATKLIALMPLGQKINMNQSDHALFSDYLYKPIRRAQIIQSMTAAMRLTHQSSKRSEKGAAAVNSFSRIDEKQHRVLIVEDNATNQEVILLMLKKIGCITDLAKNGREAIEILKTKSFDMIFMDCQMPEMDGYEAAAAIRNPASGTIDHCIPIIAMTANALEGDREACLAAGMDDYLSKPIKPPEVMKMLQRWGAPGVEKNKKLEGKKDNSISATEIFNEKDFMERLMGDRAIAEKIINQFFHEAPDQIQELKKALETNDSNARRMAHTLKGASANVGAMRMQKVSADMERFLKEGNVKEASILLPELRMESDNLKGVLTDKGYLKLSSAATGGGF